METIKEFNNWLNKNEYKIAEKEIDDVLMDEIINIHKFKSGGRNELDKYMKILITKFDLTKHDEKVFDYKDAVKGYKKEKKAEEKSNIKKEKQKEKQKENTKQKETRVIEVDNSLNCEKFIFLEKLENVITEMCVEGLGNPINNEWKVKIMKNIYSLKIDEKVDLKSDEMIGMLIYGKKLVKRDIKLITDYLTKKRKIVKKEKVVKKSEDVISDDNNEKKEPEIDIQNKVDIEDDIDFQDEIKTGIEIEDHDIGFDNDKDEKKKLYKELFGEETDSENEIDNLIVDLDEISFE